MATDEAERFAEYVDNFLGYGSLQSKVWLIGPEAGGGRTLDELRRRVTVWRERGRREVEDLQNYHAALELPKVDWSRQIQPTWGALIRILLAFLGRKSEREDILKFQISEIGNDEGDYAIFDLSQWSSQSMSLWNVIHPEIDWLSSRSKYEARTLPKRAKLIRELIERHNPHLVFFFGTGHRHWWEQIADTRFVSVDPNCLWFGDCKDRLYAMIPHPDALRPSGKGAKNQLLYDIGAAIAKRMDLVEGDRANW